ncbi:unnamed protein product [Lathyrus sativus]|nr:unnamed protein product [Lathyrus sativus]
MLSNQGFGDFDRHQHRSPSPMASSMSNVSATGIGTWNNLQQEMHNNMTLCARCFVRGSYKVGTSNTDFKRVEISEETKPDWTEKETLKLLECITNFSDDWKRVSHHVIGKTDKECVARFLKLTFWDQFMHSQRFESAHLADDSCSDLLKPSVNAGCESETAGLGKSSKRMRLTPLADASNPIMAQAAFLSALAGIEVAQAAAQAAMRSLSDVYKSS